MECLSCLIRKYNRKETFKIYVQNDDDQSVANYLVVEEVVEMNCCCLKKKKQQRKPWKSRAKWNEEGKMFAFLRIFDSKIQLNLEKVLEGFLELFSQSETALYNPVFFSLPEIGH